MRVLDLTHTIAENMPVYPGTETPIFAGANTYEKDGFKETKLTMYTHTGTHMDPPAHLFAGRTTLDAFPASQFIGKALVIECSDLNEGKAITLERILQYGKDAENADFLLFHLGWDKRWGTDAYFGDYPCLDDAALDYIIAGDYKGIGFDVIGLDPIADENLTRHKKLFQNKDIVNIENLKDLDKCGKGLFSFSCFPLKLENCDGSPIRAVATDEPVHLRLVVSRDMHCSGARLAGPHGFDAGGRNPAERPGRYRVPETAPGLSDLHLRAGHPQRRQGQDHLRGRAVPV